MHVAALRKNSTTRCLPGPRAGLAFTPGGCGWPAARGRNRACNNKTAIEVTEADAHGRRFAAHRRPSASSRAETRRAARIEPSSFSGRRLGRVERASHQPVPLN